MTEIIQVIVNGPPNAMPPIVEHVVKSGLAAAGHLAHIESTYWWDGHLEHQTEACATFHTTPQAFDTIKSEITKLHPYKVPFIAAVSLLGAPESYVEWLTSQLGPTSPSSMPSAGTATTVSTSTPREQTGDESNVGSKS